MAGLDHLVGRAYGPFALPVEAGAVADFVAATGGDKLRWRDHAPPMFANVALFSAAPAFLEDDEVVPFTRSLIHSDQTYHWTRSLAVGETLEIQGTIDSVRARGALNFVTFGLTAVSAEGPWLTGKAVFLMADEAAASAAEVTEPAVDDRGANGSHRRQVLPEGGSELTPVARSVSRSDLVRYAGATRDWNPIHWDHSAARSAGLGGVVAHGLLMGAWMAQFAQQYVDGPDPLRSLRIRFRKPLSPGMAAEVAGTVGAMDDDGVDLSMAVEADGDRLVTGVARVTR